MFDGLLRQLKDAIFGPSGDQIDRNNDRDRNVRPASEDRYGDPADSGQFGKVRPASEDPYGDPADK